MVNVAQLAEHRIVVPGVVGSNPTIHPKSPLNIRLKKRTLLLVSSLNHTATKRFASGRGAIGSALALGARGCQFESGRPDHA